MVLTYGQNITDQKTEEVDEEYMEALDQCIGTHVMVHGKESIPVLTKVIGKKRGHSGNHAVNSNNNPIIDTIIYELDFRYGRIEEFLVNTILETLWNKLMVMDGTLDHFMKSSLLVLIPM